MPMELIHILIPLLVAISHHNSTFNAYLIHLHGFLISPNINYFKAVIVTVVALQTLTLAKFKRLFASSLRFERGRKNGV